LEDKVLFTTKSKGIQLPPWLLKLARVLVIVCLPFFFGFTMIGLVINDSYPRYQYNNPNFPDDPFGFTNEERLELALVAVAYLRRSEPAEQVIYMLEEQTLPGSNQPLYNQREIDHMIDVKHLTDGIRRANQWVTMGLIIGVLLLYVGAGNRPAVFDALMMGGISTVALLALIGLFILLAWDVFFVQFHELLFPADSWMFPTSDSLIRLFPEKFWFDIGVLIVGGTLLMGLFTAFVGRLLKKGLE
jgi:integral membrane protein (TIGR01906 family)